VKKKTCEECRAGFYSSRNTQRFCSTRCANRQRDRRRRQKKQLLARRSIDAPAVSLGIVEAEPASHSITEPPARRRRREAAIIICKRAIDDLQTRLRSLSLDLEHAEAVNAEQQARISNLQTELAHLKRAQRINIKDLAHVAARLVAVTKAKGLPLDPGTVEILRRRGWISQKRRAGAMRP
jgi:chromosome segregation ATPase